MALVNHVKKEINAKLVLFGPTGAGKATTLNVIYKRLKAECRSTIKSMTIQNDRMLFFDFTAPGQKPLDGYQVRFHLYTIVSQSSSPSLWKIVLKGADGVMFVADSTSERISANTESLAHLGACLQEHGATLADIPCVIQYNKRDLAEALPVEELESSLNTYGFTSVATVAVKGDGIYDAVSRLVRMVMGELKESGLAVERNVEAFSRDQEEPSGQPPEGTEEAVTTKVVGIGGLSKSVSEDAVSPPPLTTGEIAAAIPEPVVSFAGDAQLLAEGEMRIPLAVRLGGQVKNVSLTLKLTEILPPAQF